MYDKLIITIISIFPEIIRPYINASILGNAIQHNKLQIREFPIRCFSINKHKNIDNKPYSNKYGQIIQINIIIKTIMSALIKNTKATIILLSPEGTTFKQIHAKTLSKYNHIILICGRYEGIDSRIKYYVNNIYSIGNYILTGGELPASLIIDAIAREFKNIINSTSKENESFQNKLLEYNQYTNPLNFNNHKIPNILLHGNHYKIKKHKIKEQYNKTKTQAQ